MFVERTASAYPEMAGEVIFFSGRKQLRRTRDIFPLPNTLTTARIIIMDQAIEKIEPPAVEADIVNQTQKAVSDLYSKSLFLNNPLIAGTSGRLMHEQGILTQQPPKKISEEIARLAVNEFYQRDVVGGVRPFSEHYEGDLYKAYLLANLRQSTGTLQTGNPDFDADIPYWFKLLNGQLYYTNRIDNPGKIDPSAAFKSILLALRLKEAYPDKAKQVDVYDVPLRNGGVRTGQSLTLATNLLNQASHGHLYTPHQEPIGIIPKTDQKLAKARVLYQSDATSDYQFNLGSNALAAATIIRFLSEFHPDSVQNLAIDWSLLDQAKKDLQAFAHQPGAFEDPNLVMLFGEHVSNLIVAEKFRDQHLPANISQLKQLVH